MKSKECLRFYNRYGPFAVVAGGSNGLGEAFASALARRGLNLVLIAREKDRLEAASERLKIKYSIDVITFTADLNNYENVRDFLSGRNIPIGLLVYNAAFAPIGLFENTSEEHLSQAAGVNVRTPLLLSKYLSASMIKNKRGGIVLMSSLAGMQGSFMLAAYAATKSFNTVLAQGLWKEFRSHGVDVIACCAGAISTPGYQQAKSKKEAPGTMSAAAVAEKTLNAIGKKPFVIPGMINKIAYIVLSRLLTKKTAIAIMSKNTADLS